MKNSVACLLAILLAGCDSPSQVGPAGPIGPRGERGPSGVGIPGLPGSFTGIITVTEASKVLAAGETNNVTAACATGRVIGGGCASPPRTVWMSINSPRPYDGEVIAWECEGTMHANDPEPATLTAYALCLEEP